ncbi:signal peptidase II [Sphingomicrobium astaxanthinifaciens]|uniref:signal peptidase II n=1 Tax=Sphingomicrobium astaxanthinifaciens TaxID=1227949 RepID=UPI001FCAF407|nr:signal peptidase II [Sphingomicrobium astaxanthinifaciens]MCJ7421592.1 signal peptidase II [Sphingomicrobium astaxanthinifaciens]
MSVRKGMAIALAIFIVDQLVKWWIVGPFALEAKGSVYIVDIFNLTWVENRGISLGLLAADTELGRWLLVAATAIIAAIVGWLMTRPGEEGDRLGFAMILGGALGNIVDRARFGYVVDYADLHFGSFRPFYVFNIADAAITLGVAYLLIRAFWPRREKEISNA